MRWVLAGAVGGSWGLVGLIRAKLQPQMAPDAAPKRSHPYALLPAFLALLSPPHPFLQLFLLFVVQAHNPLPAQYTSGSLLQSALRSAMKPVAAAKRAMARVASRAARGRHGGQAADTAAASAADKAGEQQAAATAVVDKAAERQAAAQKAAAGQRREVRLDVAHDPEKVVADLPMKSHLVKAGPCC
jgi:hypothetical protein